MGRMKSQRCSRRQRLCVEFADYCNDVTVERVEVTGPASVQESLSRGGKLEFLYKDKDRVAIYRAAWPGGGRSFAVNPLDTDERNIQPR
jgi:hypothetical protein